MSDAASVALSRIREYEAQIDLANAEIKKLQSFVEMYRALTGADDMPETILSAARQNDGVAARAPRKTGADAETLVHNMREILLEKGEPMTRSQLVLALEGRGLVVGGADKSKNLGTIIWRSKQFDNEGDGYWPTGATRKFDL